MRKMDVPDFARVSATLRKLGVEAQKDAEKYHTSNLVQIKVLNEILVPHLPGEGC